MVSTLPLSPLGTRKEERVNYTLDHAPNGRSRFARWEGDEEPFIGSFAPTSPRLALVEEGEEEEAEEKAGGDAMAFIQSLKEGDRLYTEMGGSSDKICAAAGARGVAVYRLPTFFLKDARVAQGREPVDNVRVLYDLARRSPERFYALRTIDLKVLNLRVYTRGYIMVQRDVRIKTQLRLLGILRDSRLIQGLPEATPEDEKSFLLGNPIFKGAEEYEKELKKRVGELLKEIPLYEPIFADIKGIGPLIAGAMIAEIQDIRRFQTPHALKAYAGYHLTTDGKKPIRGQDHWNNDLKQAVFKAVESFEKQKGSPWQEMLATRKAYEKTQHPEKLKDENQKTRFNPGHLRNRAKRYVGQQFLKHIWREWAKFEGLEVVEWRLAA